MARTGGSPTPQAVLLTLLGRYCLPGNPAIATQGYLEVLGGIGLAESAGRLTLARMTERGLLQRLRHGRLAYYRATDIGLTVVDNQDRHTFFNQSAVQDTEGAWTILSFTIPESMRKQRHLLRRRLAWEGFGMLRDGVWIAPGEIELGEMYQALREMGIDQRIEAFTGYPKFDDLAGMISRVWDLAGLTARYQQFLREWDTQHAAPWATDDLGRDLLLISTWRQLLRETPRLPAEALPANFPAARCHELFRTLHERYEPAASTLFAELLAAHRGDI